MRLELTEEWCMNAAAREGDCEVGAGILAADPLAIRFALLMNQLHDWRDQDHADALTLNRNQVIEIIEGVKALQCRQTWSRELIDREPDHGQYAKPR